MATQIQNSIIYDANGVLVRDPLVTVDDAVSPVFATVQITSLTPSTALAADASGFVVSSATTATELGYVHGVTSSIQNQLNSAFHTPSSVDLSMTTHNITQTTGMFTQTNGGVTWETFVDSSGRLNVFDSTHSITLIYADGSQYISTFLSWHFAGPGAAILVDRLSGESSSLTMFPAADSTAAIVFDKADGATPIMVLDSTNVKASIGSTPTQATAILELNSTAKGLLPPRMSTTQRDAISSPPEGLQIWNTTTHLPNFFDGTSWKAPVIS